MGSGGEEKRGDRRRDVAGATVRRGSDRLTKRLGTALGNTFILESRGIIICSQVMQMLPSILLQHKHRRVSPTICGKFRTMMVKLSSMNESRPLSLEGYESTSISAKVRYESYVAIKEILGELVS